MIHVKYRLDRSGIHGIGLFAGEKIKKGKLVYSASPVLDVEVTDKKFQLLTEKEKREVRWWGFFDKNLKRWHIDFDVSRFINHSARASLTQDARSVDAYLVATRDIKEGEELTQNYLEFESVEDLRKRGIRE